MLQANDISIAAHGRWDSIHELCSVPSEILTKKHQPCPDCGGKDRFQYTNYQDNGGYVCRGCGNGDGLKLLQLVHGWDFPTTLKAVADVLGVSEENKQPVKKNNLNAYVENNVLALTGKDPASLYLKSRKIYFKSLKDIFFLPKINYYEDGEQKGTYSALAAAIRNNNNFIIAYHVIYLNKDGTKADVKAVKKTTSEMNGSCAIYPFGFDKHNADRSGACEGLEDAISAAILCKIPVCACCGTSKLEQYEPLDSIKEFIVIGQFDKNFAGQKAAYTLAHRLALKNNKKVMIKFPDLHGDFNEKLLNVDSNQK